MHKQRQRETVMTGTHRQEDPQAMTVSTCPSDNCTSQAICLVLASSSMEKKTKKKTSIRLSRKGPKRVVEYRQLPLSSAFFRCEVFEVNTFLLRLFWRVGEKVI